MENTRALVIRAVAHLRHAYAQPNLDRALAEGLIAPEIRRLEVVIDRLDAQHAEIGELVEAARVARDHVLAQLAHATATLQRVMQILGPSVPTSTECAGCASEIGAALDALHEYGIRYQPRKPEEPPDE